MAEHETFYPINLNFRSWPLVASQLQSFKQFDGDQLPFIWQHSKGRDQLNLLGQVIDVIWCFIQEGGHIDA